MLRAVGDEDANVPSLCEQWLEHAAALAEAKHAARREPQAQPWLNVLGAKEKRLAQKLDALFPSTALSRTKSFDQKVQLWAELSRHTGLLTEGEPLATGEGVTRSREWWVTLGAAAAVIALRQPLLALLLAPIGVVWWDFCKSVTKWRMFKDCLEISEPDAPVKRIPLASIESIDHHHLRGLWDVSLKGESGFLEFAVDVRRALSERQARSKYGNQAPATWLPASLHVGEPSRASHGWVLECAHGLAFVPDSAIALAWFQVVGAPPFDGKADLGPELRSLPATLLDEKVHELAKLRGCVWLASLPPNAFMSLGEILLIEIAKNQKLFVRCSLAAQAKLMERKWS